MQVNSFTLMLLQEFDISDGYALLVEVLILLARDHITMSLALIWAQALVLNMIKHD